MTNKRVTIIITGIVQGVYFRFNTKRKADELGLAGTVRNLPTGQVEVVSEGQEAVLKQLIDWCRQDPGGAVIDKLDLEWQEPVNTFTGFSILH